MSSHDEPIGQEWTSARPTWTDVCKLIDQELGNDPAYLASALMLVAASCAIEVRQAVLDIAHDHGRHSNGRCPDVCPRF